MNWIWKTVFVVALVFGAAAGGAPDEVGAVGKGGGGETRATEQRWTTQDGMTYGVVSIPKSAPNHDRMVWEQLQRLGQEAHAPNKTREAHGGSAAPMSFPDEYVATAYCNCSYGYTGWVLWDSEYGWGTVTWMYFVSGGGTFTQTTPSFCGDNAGCTFLSYGNINHSLLYAPRTWQVEYVSPVSLIDYWCS